MFEGSFIQRTYQWNSNACLPMKIFINSSDFKNIKFDSFKSPYCNEKDVWMSSVFFPVTFLALVVSVFSLVIFAKQRQKTAFRCSMISLSLTVSLYLLFSTLDFLNVLLGACYYWSNPNRYFQVFIGSFVCLLSDCFLCLRNWCNVLIAAQRAEALVFPLKMEKCLKKKTFVILVVLLFFVSLALCSVRSLAEAFVVCQVDDKLSFSLVGYPPIDKNLPSAYEEPYNVLLHKAGFKEFELYVFFFFQTVIPINLVLFFSLVMAITILRKRGRMQTNSSKDKRTKLKASRLVLGLAVTFTILQFPSFLGAVITNFNVTTESNYGKIAQFIAELCLLVDSIFNMIVFITTVPDFKIFFSKICFCCCDAPKSQNCHCNGTSRRDMNSHARRTDYSEVSTSHANNNLELSPLRAHSSCYD